MSGREPDTAFPWDEITAEDQKKVEQWHELFRSALVQVIDTAGNSFRQSSNRAGYSHSYLGRIRLGVRKPTLNSILRILMAFEVPLDAFLRRVVALSSHQKADLYDPGLLGPAADLLEEWREAKIEPVEPFLDHIAGWYSYVNKRELPPGPLDPQIREAVLGLEGERTRDHRGARSKLQTMAGHELLPAMQKQEATLGSVAGLAAVLAAWAATRRVAGLRNQAISALAHAIRMAELSGETWSLGFCLQKAAYLAHDLGHDLEGLAFIRMATICFADGGDADDLARVMVDRGYITYYCGHHDEAERLFRCSLDRLEAVGHCKRPYQFAACQGLALVARAKGQLLTAVDHLRQAGTFVDPDSLEAAHLLWSQARTFYVAGDIESAVSHCREAMIAFGHSGQAGDVALAALGLAEMYLESGRHAELKTLGEELAGWLPSLSENAVIRLEVENLVALLRMGSISGNNINRARSVLAKAGISLAES